MKVRYIVAIAIFAIISFGGYFYYYQKNEKNNQYIKYEQQAEEDIKNNKKKYYHFGFVPMNKQNELYNTLKKNNVQIINMHCVAIPELVHYNDVILNSLK